MTKLTAAERNLLATVALSHPAGCVCDAACLPLKNDASARANVRQITHYVGDDCPGGHHEEAK